MKTKNDSPVTDAVLLGGIWETVTALWHNAGDTISIARPLLSVKPE